MNSGANPVDAPIVTRMANASSPPESGPEDGTRQPMSMVIASWKTSAMPMSQ